MKINCRKSILLLGAIFAAVFFASCQNPFLIDATKLYKVSFETNCSEQIESYRTASVEKIRELQKEDAAFVGWYTNSSFTGEAITFPYELNADTTLYAKWNQKYTVVFQTNGGTEIASYKTDAIKESPDTTREGYAFAGWYESEDFGGEAVSFPYQLTQKTILYAKWLKIYTVNFETNGGTELQSYEVSILTTSPTTTRSGYNFVGWYKESSLVNLVTFPYTLIADTTLYARWEDASNAIYTVEHYQQNTDLGGYSLIKTEKISGEAGNQTEARAQSYTGFTNKVFSQPTIAEDNSTVVKIYYDRNKYTVTFDANGGSGNTVTQEFYYGVIQALTENTYTFPGYTFSGWATKADGTVTYTDSANYNATGDATLFAKWEVAPVNYTVEHYQQTISVGNNYTLFETETLSAPTGSATQASAKTYTGFTAQSFSQATVSGNGSTVVKIYYNRNTYTVTFDANGGSGTMSEQTFYYGVTQNLSANTFEREGYTFEGWTLVSDGKSVYSDKESISDVATDTTLYAVWFYGSVVTATTVSELDLTNLTDAYTIKVTGNITQSDLVALAGKMANATAEITLDLSQTNLTTISCTTTYTSIFEKCEKLQTIILPKTMETIGLRAFSQCSGLTNINIPANIKTIGAASFYGSAITSINIDGAETIGINAFNGCENLKTAILKNINKISESAFYHSGIEMLEIDNVRTIEPSAFSNCASLKSATIKNVDTLGKSSFGGNNALTNVHLSNIGEIGEKAFGYYSPDGACASLASVTLSNITSIGAWAFANCTSLDSVTMTNVTSIGESSFCRCKSLASINIDAEMIGKYAFAGCSILSNVIIGKKVSTIENSEDSDYYSSYYRVFDACNALSSVSFLDATNWFYDKSSESYSIDVTNAVNNARIMSGSYGSSYSKYKWYKKTE